jgi:hypothetical protein
MLMNLKQITGLCRKGILLVGTRQRAFAGTCTDRRSLYQIAMDATPRTDGLLCDRQNGQRCSAVIEELGNPLLGVKPRALQALSPEDGPSCAKAAAGRNGRFRQPPRDRGRLLQSRKLHLSRAGMARDYFPTISKFLKVHRGVTDNFASGSRKGD